MNLCGDPTCESDACTSEALDAWFVRQEEEARAIVHAWLAGLLAQPDFDGKEGA